MPNTVAMGKTVKFGGQHRRSRYGTDVEHKIYRQSHDGRSNLRFTIILIISAALAFFIALGLLQLRDGAGGTAFAGTASAIPNDSDIHSARFGLCHRGGGWNCVVDGDTFWFEGQKIRVADIDTPETHPARCGREQELGDSATKRMQQLLNAGQFDLQAIDRDTDRYGRKLRIVTRGGESLGGILVAEGLARYYEGGRKPWC